MKKSITTSDLYGGQKKKKRQKILTTRDLPLRLPIQEKLFKKVSEPKESEENNEEKED